MPIDQYSVSSLYIKTSWENTDISQGTGFTYTFQNEVYLVSNWHVFSGRNPETGQPLSRGGGIPNTLTIPLLLNGVVRWRNITIGMNDEDGNPKWIQHQRGQEIDIAAIKITIPNGFTHYPINENPQNNAIAVIIAQDVYIIGFPLGINAGGALPVWKRASIASEPDVAPNGKPILLVDTATRSGMSGSPVVIRATGSFPTEDGGITLTTGTHTKFLGVYSGRLGDGELQAQLGIVWDKSLIEDLLTNPAPGSFALRP